MRWSGQLIDGSGIEPARDAQQALFDAGTVVRTFDTPGFRGSTFYEVRAKSVLNRVTADAWMFDWTVNPYRGCGHRRA